MAKATTLSNAAVLAQGTAFLALFALGKLRIYTGAQPATSDTAIGAQVLLAELTFGSPAATVANTGVITFGAVTSNAAVATGTAAWFRALQSDGTTALMDGTVDVAGNSPNLALSTTAIVATATVSVTSFTHTINKTTSGL